MNLTPGWHPFPNDPTQEIYWDGERWTESRATQEEVVDEDPYGVKTKMGVGMMLLFALLLLALIVIGTLYFTGIGEEILSPVKPVSPPASVEP